MILKELEYISEIAKYENLSAAARNLPVSEAALSLHVTALEKKLGIKLFIREKNRLKITPEGVIYVQTAREMLKLRNDLYRQLRDMTGKPKLRIGLSSAYSFHIFSRVLSANKSLYTGLDISVSEGRAIPLISQLERNSLDFVIAARDRILTPPDCIVKLIRREPFALYLSPNHPLVASPPGDVPIASPVGSNPPVVDFSLFRNEQFVLSPKDTSDGIVACNILDEYCPGYQIFCNINNTLAIMEMVKNQIGVTIMPLYAVFSTPLCRELYWCVPQKQFHRYVQLIYRRDHALNSFELSIIDNIQKAYDAESLY